MQRRICPNCGVIMGSNQMYCSGACRKESERNGSNLQFTPDGCLALIGLFVGLPALFGGISLVYWLFDTFGWLRVICIICIIPTLWCGFKFVRWLLEVWRRSSP